MAISITFKSKLHNDALLTHFERTHLMNSHRLSSFVCCFALGMISGCARDPEPRVAKAPAPDFHITPSSQTLVLGENLTIRYFLPAELDITKLRLEIKNKHGFVICRAHGLPSVAGALNQAVWPRGAWNQPPHDSALANPSNGPYSVQVEGETPYGRTISNVLKIHTVLVLWCDLTDDKPSKTEISSGLYPPVLDTNSPECLRVGLVPVGGQLNQTVYATESAVFSKIVKADLDNDPENGLEIKSAHMRQQMPPNYANGEYNVVLTGLRDVAGNRGAFGSGPDGIVRTWKITLY
jgi:hypothetical protein